MQQMLDCFPLPLGHFLPLGGDNESSKTPQQIDAGVARRDDGVYHFAVQFVRSNINCIYDGHRCWRVNGVL